jgi:hypothetical protein
MRIRLTIVSCVVMGATLIPTLGVTHAQAANTTCLATASGQPITPNVNLPIAEVFADEDIQGTGDCGSLSGDVFTVFITVTDEYLNISTGVWAPTSCPPVNASNGSNGNPSTAVALGSTGCTFIAGDPSLNTLHHAHTHLTTSNGVTPQDAVSAPWLAASA